MLDTLMETAVIKNAVRLACHAPSLYNSQPWLWVADGARVDLFLDPSRVMHTDRSQREALISCGAVLDHLRVAMAAAGWTADIDRFPSPDKPDHLATIEFTPSDYVTDDQRRRADAILLVGATGFRSWRHSRRRLPGNRLRASCAAAFRPASAAPMCCPTICVPGLLRRPG